MNVRRTNLLLRAVAATTGCAAAAVAVWGLLAPIGSGGGGTDDELVVARPATRPSRPGDGGPAVLPPLDAFAPVWAVRLRQPLPEPAAVVPPPAAQIVGGGPRAAAAATAGSPPPFALVGTIGDAIALLRAPDGAVEVRSVGETMAAATVLAVRSAEVEVRFNGQVVTLRRAPDATEPDPFKSPTEPVPPAPDPAASDGSAPSAAAIDPSVPNDSTTTDGPPIPAEVP